MTNKKRLKQSYKDSKPMMGVFRVYNKALNTHLLATSTNLSASLNRSRFELKMGSHKNGKLKMDWANQLESDFSFEIVHVIESKPSDDIKQLLDEQLEYFMGYFAQFDTKSY